jgi:hypothetical protein
MTAVRCAGLDELHRIAGLAVKGEEAEIRIAELRAEIASLQRQLAALKRSAPITLKGYLMLALAAQDRPMGIPEIRSAMVDLGWISTSYSPRKIIREQLGKCERAGLIERTERGYYRLAGREDQR